MHGGHDVLTVSQAQQGLRLRQGQGRRRHAAPARAEEETGAEHCQHDNPTIGQEILADWLADRFGIDQRKLLATSRRIR